MLNTTSQQLNIVRAMQISVDQQSDAIGIDQQRQQCATW
jgi:hypothetical protein